MLVRLVIRVSFHFPGRGTPLFLPHALHQPRLSRQAGMGGHLRLHPIGSCYVMFDRMIGMMIRQTMISRGN